MGKTKLRLINNAISFYLYPNTLSNGQSGFLRAYEENNIKYTDMTIDGNHNGQKQDGTDRYTYGKFGVYTEACDDILIEKLEVINFSGYGLDPHGTGGEPIWGNRLIVKNCVIKNNEWDGCTIDKTDDFICENNVIEDNGRHGINIVTGSRNGKVRNNVLRDNGYFYNNNAKKGCGIMGQNNQLYGTKNIDIYNNQIYDSAKGNICLNSVDNFDVYNNYMKGSISNCIRLQKQSDNSLGTKNTHVYDNNCDGDDRGIIINGKSYNNKIEDNQIKTVSGTIGIENKEENKNSASNQICGNSYYGAVHNHIRYNDVYSQDIADCDGNPNPTPKPTPAPTLPDGISDPTCANGTPSDNGKYCCLGTCEVCGGSECSSQNGGKYCCVSGVKETNRDCDTQSAPCLINQNSNPTPKPTPKPILPGVGDPYCSTGVFSSKYCCPASCGSCGGSECSSRPGGRDCCISKIKEINHSCNDYLPPCIIDSVPALTPTPTPKPTPTPILSGDPNCSSGILNNGKYCCPLSCGSCGGSECSSRPGGRDCCVSRIKELDNDCSETEAPCIIKS